MLFIDVQQLFWDDVACGAFEWRVLPFPPRTFYIEHESVVMVDEREWIMTQAMRTSSATAVELSKTKAIFASLVVCILASLVP